MSRTSPIDLNVPRKIGEILRAALMLYGRYPLLFLILAGAVIVPFELIVLAVTGYGPLHTRSEGFVSSSIVRLLRDFFVGPLVSALHIHAVKTAGDGERPRIAAVARRSLAALPVVVAAAIVSWIGITVGTIALVIPGLLLSLRWSVVAQAAAVEKLDWLGALRRSADLTRDNWAHIFGLFLVIGVIVVIFAIGVAAIPLGGATSPGSVTVGVAMQVLTTSFGALTLALLYFDLLARLGDEKRRIREHQHLRDLD